MKKITASNHAAIAIVLGNLHTVFVVDDDTWKLKGYLLGCLLEDGCVCVFAAGDIWAVAVSQRERKQNISLIELEKFALL